MFFKVMRCPFCGNEETQVKDSRIYAEGCGIKRRRYCPNCDSKFNTMESVIFRDITVIKKDGKKESFDREKLFKSIKNAVCKRIPDDEIEKIVFEVTKKIETTGNSEVKSTKIGEILMDKLERIDKVAFIRFASAYMDFESPDDFDKFIKKIQEN